MSLSKTALPSGASVVVGSTLECEGGRYVFDTGSWATSDSTIVRVTAPARTSSSRQSGTLATLGPGTATITVSVGGLSATARVTVLPALRFASVVGTGGGVYSHTCGVTSSGTAYCWGNPSEGVLGVDTATDDCGDACNAIPRPVGGGHAFTALTTAAWQACGLTPAGEVYCWGAGYGHDPVNVAASVSFTALSAGESHVCGLATDGEAYCWGGNGLGQLGDGTRQYSSAPVKVGGGVSFVTISAGWNHTCALAPGGTAYCWGSNDLGFSLLPAPRDTASSALPARVGGDKTFVSLSAGAEHTCGLAADGTTWCWGVNGYGELGFDTARDTTCGFTGGCTRTPGLAAGGQVFALLDASGYVTCGIDGSGQAYCWGGLRKAGTCAPARGDGTSFGPFGCYPQYTQVTTPERIASAVPFSAHSGSGGCWLGLDGIAYCWDGHEGTVPLPVPGQ